MKPYARIFKESGLKDLNAIDDAIERAYVGNNDRKEAVKDIARAVADSMCGNILEDVNDPSVGMDGLTKSEMKELMLFFAKEVEESVKDALSKRSSFLKY